MAPVLIDTNLLIYVFDAHTPEKQAQAIRVLKALEQNGSGRLGAQNLAEFFAASTRRLRPRLTAAEALTQVERLAQAFPVLPLTDAVVLEAARGVRDHSLSYYDAQVWAAARLNQVPLIFSEDFSPGRVIEGIRFVDPFAAGFDLAAW